jgi:hypothetical protein
MDQGRNRPQDSYEETEGLETELEKESAPHWRRRVQKNVEGRANSRNISKD